MDLLTPLIPQPTVHPGRTLAMRVVDVLIADGEGFRTRSVPSVDATLEGIPGDRHQGFTRKAGGREPWYPRGTEIRSGRQLTAVSAEDLALIAADLQLPAVDPGLIGANLVLEGLAHFSFLPAGTLIVFESGASLVIEGQNAPCRFSGRSLADAHPGRDDLELGFAKAGARRRGVLASVERAGLMAPGTVKVRLPEQWVYQA
ncbi:MOSC domain-containing protein [Chthonobacter rhizosphaerae]|uniref:MOSC domain-containing protein n=1 Tax=Chthonobacter rhizosphaerae TaxID=2735553 RepID=UPI0015EF43AF|nr:MOSC domain-containing protein [Chthonobacter rhizosphaerae]